MFSLSPQTTSAISKPSQSTMPDYNSGGEI